MIYVLYGQPGSGKTTLGKLLAEHLNTPFIIDGDEFREMFSNKNYGKVGREENIRNANAVATYLNKKGKSGEWKAVYVSDKKNGWKSHPVHKETDVVMCLVNPYRRLRDELRENNALSLEQAKKIREEEGELVNPDSKPRFPVVEILLRSSRELRKKYHVKDFEDGFPNLTVGTDRDAEDTWSELKKALKL